MFCIDVLDTAVSFNGQVVPFPMSYEDIRAVLGDARVGIVL